MKRVTFLTFLFLALVALGTANAQVINIMTTPPGSSTHSSGSAIGKLIIEKTGMNATVQPQAVRNYGVVDSGLAVFSLGAASDLVLAAHGKEEYEEEARRLGIDGYVRKPFDVGEVQRIVDSC